MFYRNVCWLLHCVILISRLWLLQWVLCLCVNNWPFDVCWLFAAGWALRTSSGSNSTHCSWLSHRGHRWGEDRRAKTCNVSTNSFCVCVCVCVCFCVVVYGHDCIIFVLIGWPGISWFSPPRTQWLPARSGTTFSDSRYALSVPKKSRRRTSGDRSNCRKTRPQPDEQNPLRPPLQKPSAVHRTRVEDHRNSPDPAIPTSTLDAALHRKEHPTSKESINWLRERPLQVDEQCCKLNFLYSWFLSVHMGM